MPMLPPCPACPLTPTCRRPPLGVGLGLAGVGLHLAQHPRAMWCPPTPLWGHCRWGATCSLATPCSCSPAPPTCPSTLLARPTHPRAPRQPRGRLPPRCPLAWPCWSHVGRLMTTCPSLCSPPSAASGLLASLPSSRLSRCERRWRGVTSCLPRLHRGRRGTSPSSAWPWALPPWCSAPSSLSSSSSLPSTTTTTGTPSPTPGPQALPPSLQCHALPA